jgi:hypothetical protein
MFKNLYFTVLYINKIIIFFQISKTPNPEIKTFMETPLGRQINFVFITEDREDQVKTFHERYGFNIYRVNKLKDVNVYSIPVTYLLNEKHEIVKSDLGSWDWNQENLKNEISTLIK